MDNKERETAASDARILQLARECQLPGYEDEIVKFGRAWSAIAQPVAQQASDAAARKLDAMEKAADDRGYIGFRTLVGELRALLAATAAPQLVPKWMGEFRRFSDWVRHAQDVLKSPSHAPAICVDAKGRRCASGKDFMRARDEDAFPVRYFWECQGSAPAAQQPSETAIHKEIIEALKFYFEGHHFYKHDPDVWDTVSGEPANFQEDEACTATVEDGSVAKLSLEKWMALRPAAQEANHIAFNPNEKCSPTLTQCPRCNNPHNACDQELGAAQEAEKSQSDTGGRILAQKDIEYPRDVFSDLISNNSPYAFYLFQWVPYQTEAKRWRMKMCHDARTFDGREAHGIWPNGSRCGPFRDDEVEFIRISHSQHGEAWQDPRPTAEGKVAQEAAREQPAKGEK